MVVQMTFRRNIEEILSGEKIHTCRYNFDYWQDKIARLKETGGTLLLRCKKNPQEEYFKPIPAEQVGVQLVIIRRDEAQTPHGTREQYFYAQPTTAAIDIEQLAHNDGLSTKDFISRIAPYYDRMEERLERAGQPHQSVAIAFAVVHFTDFRYGFPQQIGND